MNERDARCKFTVAAGLIRVANICLTCNTPYARMADVAFMTQIIFQAAIEENLQYVVTNRGVANVWYKADHIVWYSTRQ